jgi:uncharacterized LabA/DUF88 family protein
MQAVLTINNNLSNTRREVRKLQLAILIDFYNLFMMLNKDLDKTKAALGEIIKMGRRRGEVLEARLFVPIYFLEDPEEVRRMWRWTNTVALMFGLEIEACTVSSRHTDEGRRMKDSVDNAVMMHIINNIHKDIGPELIVFVTGDGDFLKFSTQAQNRSKKTEFWSVNPGNTNMLIRQEGNFQEIEVPSSDQDNLFVVAVNKKLKKIVLEKDEQRRLGLISQLAHMQLPTTELADMSVLIGERLGIAYAEANQLLEMLISLEVVEVTPAIKRVTNVNYLHVLFQYLKAGNGVEGTVNPQAD